MMSTGWWRRVDLGGFLASPISKQLVDGFEYLLRIDVASDADNGVLRCEVLGIKDVVSKSIGSSNPMNVLRACIKGLRSQSSPKIIAKLRGQNISEITKKKH